MKREALKLLKQIYGYDSFRKGQNHIISSVLNRRDTLGVMSTGEENLSATRFPLLFFRE